MPSLLCGKREKKRNNAEHGRNYATFKANPRDVRVGFVSAKMRKPWVILRVCLSRLTQTQVRRVGVSE